jgi:hypothetical protein
MNDTELDELLDTWKTPPLPRSLKETVHARIAAKRRRRPWELLSAWRLLTAGAAAAALVFLLANTSAFSEKVSPPPYTVDSEITLYPVQRVFMLQPRPNSDSRVSRCWSCWIGSGPESALMTSFNQAGTEVVLSWSAPGHPFEGAVWAAKLAASNAIGRVTRRFLLTPDEEAERGDFAVVYSAVGQSWTVGERATLLNSGCQPSDRQGKVVGQEVILNYPTIAAQHDYWKTRMTLWMAPELSCFALRATVEVQQQDGTWTLVSEKRAVKVTVNR